MPISTILFFFLLLLNAVPSQQLLFREYIGAEGNNVTFTDVPINPSIDFHFILSFAIDYTSSSHPSPTNGIFKPYWDTQNLGLFHISSIKSWHPNVKVAMSLGGDTVANQSVVFKPKELVSMYNLDGIDIDYEHFEPGADTNTFVECIGQLLSHLKRNNIIKFASIAPFDDDDVQRHYMALWNKYGHLIDYVNFQFYAYDKGTNIQDFLKFYHVQSSNYRGGKVLASFGTDDSGGLRPAGGFFKACSELWRENKFHGIFIWSADDSKKLSFRPEIDSQCFLAAPK
ncbi:Chitinase 1 [Linum perenne]